jgi:putative glutamine amidotransferase
VSERNPPPSGPPRILITVQAPERSSDEDLADQKNDHYGRAVRAAGGEPAAIDETSSQEERAAAFATMDALLLSGGTDVHPSMYGAPVDGSRDIETGRDELELAAWQAARERRLPVLGICRGMQALNVFSGGSLIQHVEGHASGSYPAPPLRHPLRLTAGSRLARILRPHDPVSAVLTVNSYHHQGLRRPQVAPGLLVAGTSPHPGGELVEALESAHPDDFVFGVQCHPERTDTTPPDFERLFRVFVDAARGSAAGDRVG